MHWFKKLHDFVLLFLFQLHSSDGGDAESGYGGHIPPRSSHFMSELILYCYGEKIESAFV
jgi:hypothetical protein